MRLADELRTRLVPIELAEGAYARNRPPGARPPWPRVGDEVYYRRNAWDVDDDLWRMRVVDVQDPDDQTSDWASNLWEVLRGNWTGQPLHGRNGELLILPVADPWPWVHLRWEGDIPKGSQYAWMGTIQMTWESRIRGSAGWLPLDYETTRQVRLPGQLVMQPLAVPDRSAAVNAAPPSLAPPSRGSEGGRWLPSL